MQILKMVAIGAIVLAFAGCQETQSQAVQVANQGLAQMMAASQITDTIGMLLNGERSARGLSLVRPSAQLARVALGHAQDMEQRDFFSHVSSNGRTLAARARAAGYGFCFIAENIAQGQDTVAEVHVEWMNSQGHRDNNLSPNVTEFGIALVDDSWVLVLGKDGC